MAVKAWVYASAASSQAPRWIAQPPQFIAACSAQRASLAAPAVQFAR